MCLHEKTSDEKEEVVLLINLFSFSSDAFCLNETMIY